ncbi:MAG: response regulator transcription factor [Actinobacteria bacterium]|nr:response regulator transcription factor [Actinomycetota bacterium]
MLRILIVEDEPSYREALAVALGAEGFRVETAATGREGVSLFRAEHPDIVLLDLMLPELSGLDVLRAIRGESDVPVIVVSAKDSESDVVSALELGADDYLRKPYSIRELVARIRVSSRRSQAGDVGDDEPLVFGNAVLDPGTYEVRIGSVAIDLPRKEFALLRQLMERSGRIVAREMLLESVWGIHWTDSKTLDQHVRRLRRKFEGAEGAPEIVTVRGVGYRLTHPEQ